MKRGEHELLRSSIPTLEWTIAETVTCWPQTISTFLRFRMACVGCAMDAFETLREAAVAYGKDPEQVLSELIQIIHKKGK